MSGGWRGHDEMTFVFDGSNRVDLSGDGGAKVVFVLGV